MDLCGCSVSGRTCGAVHLNIVTVSVHMDVNNLWVCLQIAMKLHPEAYSPQEVVLASGDAADCMYV